MARGLPMGEWTLRFEEVSARDVARVGGKAANVGEMTRAGLPVPPGFCVTADAYRELIETSETWPRIEGLLAGLDTSDARAVDAAAGEIRRLLVERPMPAEIGTAIAARYRELAAAMNVPLDDASEMPVAVRSSATAEDMPDASFAGQQDTYLNIRGEAALLDSVRRCWASLWTARAVTYRARQGYDHETVALAIAVQAMVQADVAGVMFTADPVTSDRSRLVVNASWGLGEAIVSGLVSPDTWTIAKDGFAVVSREIGLKERQVIRSVDGGTVEIDVSPDKREIASLSDIELAGLATIGLRIEGHYGAPMDVEWAFANGRAYVLQARPITTLQTASTLAAADAAADAVPAGDYNRTMFLEIFPEPLSPAFLSVIGPLLKDMLDFTFRTLGFQPPKGIPPVGAFHNQPYFNQRYIEAALAPLKPGTRSAFVAQIVNPFGRQSRGAVVELSLPFLRMGWHFLNLMRSLHRTLPRVVRRYRAEIADLDRLRLEELSDSVLAQRIVRLVFETANRLIAYDFLLIALTGVTYQGLGSLLERYFGDETEEVRARLISGVTGNVTMETNKRLWDRAEIARRSPGVSAPAA